MVKSLQICLFGDQTYDVSKKLRELLYTQKSSILESFFEQVYGRLREEVGHLPSHDREVYPRFTSIADLLSWRERQNTTLPALENALTCIYQLGLFIRFADSFI